MTTEKIFVLAPDEVANECQRKAGMWMAGPAGGMFNDVRSVARSAVAEYLANEKGFTMYSSLAKYPKDKS